MKKSTYTLLSMVFTIVLISSCTVLKQQDFTQHKYLDAAKHHKSIAFTDQFLPKKKIEKVAHITSYVSPNNLDELEPLAMATHSEKTIEIVQLGSTPTLNDSLKTKEYGCDMITLSNGTVQSIKVTHVDHKQIKYKKCENGIIKGITFTVNKTDNFILQYAGGEKILYPLTNPNDYYSTNAANEEVANKKVMVAGIILGIALTLLLFISFGII